MKFCSDIVLMNMMEIWRMMKVWVMCRMKMASERIKEVPRMMKKYEQIGLLDLVDLENFLHFCYFGSLGVPLQHLLVS